MIYKQRSGWTGKMAMEAAAVPFLYSLINDRMIYDARLFISYVSVTFVRVPLIYS